MEVVLSYSEHNTYFMNTVASFCEKEDYLDVKLICRNGNQVMANSLVLSCVSPFLKLLFSECTRKDDAMTVLLPDVDSGILRLIMDFIFEGKLRVTKKELKELKDVLKMLDMRFPGSRVNERNVQNCPSVPPPQTEKIRKKTPGNSVNNGMERDSEPATKTRNTIDRENSNTAEDLATGRRASEPDDDPLNVPDFYFNVSSASTGVGAVNERRSSNTRVSSLNQQPQDPRQSESHSRSRSRTSDADKSNQSSTTRKRRTPNSNSDTTGAEQGEKRIRRRHNDTHLKETTVNETQSSRASFQRTKSRKT